MIRSLLKFLLGKMLRLVVLLAAISILSFMMVKMAPIDPVQAYVGADLLKVSEAQREQIAAYWGLDQPPLAQFLTWGSAVLKGNLGTSMTFRQPVTDVIAERFLSSLALMVSAWALSGLIGFAAGAAAAMNRNTWVDRMIHWYCYTLAATPAFWLGLLLIMVFSVWLGWFPLGLGVPAGMAADQVTLGDRIYHMFLPALVLSVTGIATIALHTRQKLAEVLDSDYIIFARARGERGFGLFWRHGLRNIALPALTFSSLPLASCSGELYWRSRYLPIRVSDRQRYRPDCAVMCRCCSGLCCSAPALYLREI